MSWTQECGGSFSMSDLLTATGPCQALAHMPGALREETEGGPCSQQLQLVRCSVYASTICSLTHRLGLLTLRMPAY